MDEFAQLLSNLSSGAQASTSNATSSIHPPSSAPDFASFFGGSSSAMSQPQLFPPVNNIGPGGGGESPSTPGFSNNFGGVFSGLSPAQAHQMQMVAQQRMAAANKAMPPPSSMPSGFPNVASPGGSEAMARLMAMVQNSAGGSSGNDINHNLLAALGGGGGGGGGVTHHFSPGAANFGMGTQVMDMGMPFSSGSSSAMAPPQPAPPTPAASHDWGSWNRPSLFNGAAINPMFGGAFGLPTSSPGSLLDSHSHPTSGLNPASMLHGAPQRPQSSTSSHQNFNSSNIGSSSSGEKTSQPPTQHLNPDQIKALESLGIPSSELQAAGAPHPSSSLSRPASTKPTERRSPVPPQPSAPPPPPQEPSSSGSNFMSMITGSLAGNPPSSAPSSSAGPPNSGFPVHGVAGQPNINYLLSLAKSGQLPPSSQAGIQSLIQSGRFGQPPGPANVSNGSSQAGVPTSNPMNGVEMALGSLLGKGSQPSAKGSADSGLGAGGARSFLPHLSSSNSGSALTHLDSGQSRPGPPQLTIKVEALKEHVSHLNQLRLYQAQIEHMERCLREGMMIPFSAPGLPAPANLTTQPLDMQSRTAIEMKLGEFRRIVPQLHQMIQRFHITNGGEENVNTQLSHITNWQHQQQRQQQHNQASSPPKPSPQSSESKPPFSMDSSRKLSQLSQFHQVYDGRATGNSTSISHPGSTPQPSTPPTGPSAPTLTNGSGSAALPGVSSAPHPPNPVPSFDGVNNPTPPLSSSRPELQIGQIIPLKLLQTQLRPDTFMKALFDMMRHRGTPITGTPYIEGKEVDLYHLYQAVMNAGGSADVDKADGWADIANCIGLLFQAADAEAKVQTASQLKGLYRSLLAPFEEVWTKALIKQQQQLKDYYAATGQLNMFAARHSTPRQDPASNPPTSSSTSTGVTPAMSSAAHAALGLTPPNPNPIPKAVSVHPTPPPSNPPSNSPTNTLGGNFNPPELTALAFNSNQGGGFQGASSLLPAGSPGTPSSDPRMSQAQPATDLSTAMLARCSSDEKKLIEDAKQTIEELKSKLQAHRPKLKIIEHMGEGEKEHIRKTVPQLAPMIDRVLGILHLYLAMSNQVEAARRLLLMVCMFRDQMDHLSTNEFMLSSSDIDKLKTQMERCWIFVHHSPAAQHVRQAEAFNRPLPDGIGLLAPSAASPFPGGAPPPPPPLTPSNSYTSQNPSLKRPTTWSPAPMPPTSDAPGTASHPIDLDGSPSTLNNHASDAPRVKRQKIANGINPTPPAAGPSQSSQNSETVSHTESPSKVPPEGEGKGTETRGRGRGRGRGGGRGRGRGRGTGYKTIMQQVKNESTTKPSSGSTSPASGATPPEEASDKGKGKGKSPTSSVPPIEVNGDSASPLSTPASKQTPATTVASKSPDDRQTSEQDANMRDPDGYLENMLKGFANGAGNAQGSDGSAIGSDLSEFLAQLQADAPTNFKAGPDASTSKLSDKESSTKHDFPFPLPHVGSASSVATTSASTLTPSFPAAAAALGISSLGTSTSSPTAQTSQDQTQRPPLLDFDFLDPAAFGPSDDSVNAGSMPHSDQGLGAPGANEDSTRIGGGMAEDELQRYQKMFGNGEFNGGGEGLGSGLGGAGDEFSNFLAGLNGDNSGSLLNGGGDGWDFSSIFKADVEKLGDIGREGNQMPWSFS